MEFQRRLFDVDAGRAARDEALAVVGGDDPNWKDRALEACYQVALTNRMFASDDIWRYGLDKPREPRALGPVMMRACKLGYCERTEMTRASSSVTQHAQPIRIYRSLVIK
jgi:hypothetical protein